jgi:hypothetical protein
MLETINEQLKTNFYQHPEIQSYLKLKKSGKWWNFTFAAAQKLLEKYFKKNNLFSSSVLLLNVCIHTLTLKHQEQSYHF